jgi:hypothetical protein
MQEVVGSIPIGSTNSKDPGQCRGFVFLGPAICAVDCLEITHAPAPVA